jgi:hypothetical protein
MRRFDALDGFLEQGPEPLALLVRDLVERYCTSGWRLWTKTTNATSGSPVTQE